MLMAFVQKHIAQQLRGSGPDYDPSHWAPLQVEDHDFSAEVVSYHASRTTAIL
jgi:hypothetical protein